jgi:phosphoribosyl 1,2-cyclic phosphate phosphodiesterase
MHGKTSNIKLSFLGTGTSQGVPVIACDCEVCKSQDPKDKRLRVSVWIQVDGKSFVIDAGPDFRYQMLRAGVKKLDALLLTHEHKDHIAGLDDIRAFNYRTKSAMDVYATIPVQEALKREYHYVFDDNPYPGVPQVNLHTISTKEFKVQGVDVMPIEVLHYMLPVLGFRIGNMAYVTDAKTISIREKEKLKGCDVLILNALRKKEHISHLNLDEALAWIAELKPKRAYLTHISHLMGTHAEVSAQLPEGVFLAYDGLSVEL